MITEDDVRDVRIGRDLDSLLAEFVVGYEWRHFKTHGNNITNTLVHPRYSNDFYIPGKGQSTKPPSNLLVPPFSKKTGEHIWGVVSHLTGMGWEFTLQYAVFKDTIGEQIEYGWCASFGHYTDNEDDFKAVSATVYATEISDMVLAVCQAALLTAIVEKGKALYVETR